MACRSSRQQTGSWLQTQDFSCATCGKYHCQEPFDDEGRSTAPFTGFKCCAYCHQAQYCSQVSFPFTFGRRSLSDQDLLSGLSSKGLEGIGSQEPML